MKKISHKEPRVNDLKLVKRSAKVDSSRSVSYGKSSAESRKKMNETQRKDGPSKIGIHPREL